MWELLTELGTELGRSLPLILGLISIALVIVLLVIAHRLARASEVASDTLEDDASRLESAREEGEVAVVDLRSSSAIGPLRRSFEKVGRLLRRLLPGPRPRYQTPWFLSLGAAGAGKTTLLGQTRLVLPMGEPDASAGTAPPGVNWWLFDRAVVLDVDGDLVLQGTGTGSDQPTWRGLLHLLRQRRGRRPSDGVLLSIPATELLGFQAADPEAQEALAARASVLRRKLWRAQERLGMQLPVYLLVTKCDLVPGFHDFTGFLGADERRQIFGWSSPDPPETPYNAGWVDTAWRSVEVALARFQLRTAGAAPEELPGSRDLVAFPAALETLKEPLRIYMNQIFSAGAASEPFPFRGLFFCGGNGIGVDAGESPHRLPAAGGWDELPLGGLPGDAHRRVDFVADLVGGKMLYEWNLAQPTASARRSGHRRVWALQAALVAGLLLGPLALWSGVRLSGIRADTLDQELLSPLLGTLRPGEASPGEAPPGEASPGEASPDELTSEQLAERAVLALDAAAQVTDYHLQTALLPWGGRADRELRRAMIAVYRDAVFPAARRSLDRQIGELEKPISAGTPPAKIWNVGSTPEFQQLQRRTARLTELERDVARFNCFTPAPCTVAGSKVEIFRALVGSLFGKDLRYPSRSARSFYAELFEEVRVAPYSAADRRPALQRRVLVTSDAMYRRLFDDNVLTRDLGVLGPRINRLADRAPAAEEVPGAYRRLLDTVDDTRDDLARPELAWAGSGELDLGDDFDDWLKAVIGSDLLGRSTASEIRRRGEAGFGTFRRNLAAASSAVGPLLASMDGAVELQLSPPVLGLEGNLRKLLAQSFMKPAEHLEITVEPPAGTALYWRPQPLAEAVAMADEHRSFTADVLPAFGALRQTTGTAAQRNLESRLLDQVSRAQDFRDAPNLFTTALRRSDLAAQVANLQSVTGDLDTLLATFEAPPPAALAGDCAGYCTSRASTGWCLFSAILESQQRNLIEGADELLTAEALYTPREGDFAWWDGTGNLALQAFGVATKDDLGTYLAGQESRVQTLAQQYASPVLTGLQTKDCWGFSAQPEIRRFKVILSDLSAVKNQTPNNAVMQLEDFVTATMPTVTLDNCLTAVTPGTACFAATTPVDLQQQPPCDYFLARRGSLATGIAARCREITAAAAREGWAAISRSFANRLEGKYPFTAELSHPLEQEATPADVENFFRVFDRHRGVVEGFLAVAGGDEAGGESASSAVWAPEGVRAMERFMTRMTAVREFFAPFLAARAEKPAAVPVFDLQVQFRVNQAHEVGGNQIFGWDFAVDGQEIAPGDVDPPGRWSFGEPVKLALTWAANAPSVPLSPKQANARRVGETVIYEYENGWSLISLLGEHEAPPGDFTEFVDTDPETLVFEIPTRERPTTSPTAPPPAVARPVDSAVDDGVVPRSKSKPASPPPPPSATAPADSTTKVFLRLTLMTPDGSKTELAFPTFPTAVPPFAEQTSP